MIEEILTCVFECDFIDNKFVSVVHFDMVQVYSFAWFQHFVTTHKLNMEWWCGGVGVHFNSKNNFLTLCDTQIFKLCSPPTPKEMIIYVLYNI